MVRVMGNSPERVELEDLHDVVYYKQLKEFSTQQLEISKDLKRELQKGRLIVIEQKEVSQGSGEVSPHQWVEPPKSLNLNDLKMALREVLPEFKGDNGVSENTLKGAIRDLAPLIVDMVRQEVTKIGVVKEDTESKTVDSKFEDLIYVPTILDSGLKSNITAKKREVSGDSMSDALKALKSFKKT